MFYEASWTKDSKFYCDTFDNEKQNLLISVEILPMITDRWSFNLLITPIYEIIKKLVSVNLLRW